MRLLNEQDEKYLIQVAMELISFPTEISYRSKKAPDSDCAEHVKELLKENGFNVVLITQWHEKIEKNIYSILAWKGQQIPRILFLGHLDVVPADSRAWHGDPYSPRMEGDKLIGRGAADMKGPVAAMITAFHDFDPKDLGTVMLLFTGDEEEGGYYSTPAAMEYLKQHDMMPLYVINGEPSNHEIVTKRRGLAQFQVTLQNDESQARGIRRTKTFKTMKIGDQSLHTARFFPGADVHALIAASKALLGKKIIHVNGDFLKENRVPREVTVQFIDEDSKIESTEVPENLEFSLTLTQLFKALPGIIGINFPTEPSITGRSIAPNILDITKDHVKISFDIRAMTNDLNSIQQAIKAHFSQFITTSFDVKLLRSTEMMNVSPDHPLPSSLIKAARKAGITVPHVGEKIGGGASDSRFFTNVGIPAAEIGPIHDGAHSPNEWVSISSLKSLARVYRHAFEILTEALTQDPW